MQRIKPSIPDRPPQRTHKAGGAVEIIAQPHPFEKPVYADAAEGQSIAEMLTGRPGPVTMPLHVLAGDPRGRPRRVSGSEFG